MVWVREHDVNFYQVQETAIAVEVCDKKPCIDGQLLPGHWPSQIGRASCRERV